ncbi:MAG: DUF882 domain-containing protein [Pseudomonadota bacterium]
MLIHDPSAKRLTRRTLLAWGGAAALACVARPGVAREPETGSRRIVLHNTHTQESLVTDYCRDGAYCTPALQDVAHLLRDHRNGAVHDIDPNLLDLLCAAAERCGRDAEFEVISGYRSPESNAAMHARSPGVASHSLHMDGRAMDVRLVGCDLARLRDSGLVLARGGVGFYRDLQFVHLDTGRVRVWNG